MFTLSLILLPHSFGATSTQTVTYQQSLQPVEGEWYYFERNCILDFEEYLDGSAPNLTSTGVMDDESILGVYKADNEIYTELFGENVTRFPGDIDTTYLNVTEGYNNSQASWENVTINSNSSIYNNITGYYQGYYNFKNNVTGADPDGWTVNEPSGTSIDVEGTLLGRKYFVYINDTTASANCYMNNSFTIQSTGVIEFTTSIISGNSELFFLLYEGYGNWKGYLRLSANDGIMRVTFAAASHSVCNFTLNPLVCAYSQFYDWRIVFNATSDMMQIYRDNELTYWDNGGSPDSDFPFNVVATSGIDGLYIGTATVQIGKFVIDTIDYSWISGYYTNRIYFLENQDAYYLSNVIDMGYHVNVSRIVQYADIYTNATLDLDITSNLTGNFDNWENYATFDDENIRYIRFRLYLNVSFAHLCSIFYALTIHFENTFNLFPSLNDRNLIIHSTTNETQNFFRFNMSEAPHFTEGEIEFVFLHAILPNQTDNGSNMFTILFDGELQFNYALTDYDGLNGSVYGNWSIWEGGNTFQNIYYHEYTYFNETGMYYEIYDVVINYVYNSRTTIEIYRLLNTTYSQLLFNQTNAVVTTSTGDLDYAEFYFGTNETQYETMVFLGIDSSRLGVFYEKHQILDFVTKSFNTYNVEETFTMYIPSITTDMAGAYVSEIKIKSDLPYNLFTSFFCDVQGSEGEQTFTVIDTLTLVDNSTYDPREVYGLTFNTRYRCKNLNYFENVITMQVSFIYTPVDVGVMSLFLMALPSVILLVVPSGTAYLKFKRNGFLIVFFMMTLILTAIGMIPLVIGILMILCQVIIFLKLMQRDSHQGDEI